ncbi:hypothetical protein BLNAU_6083 [Blattamonas nauphoetae]|uniref:Transmembrane protein n=1 Tax=Blattamonas nauphoetae TaxID=2049346 RepID=A0ABQ9Y570_9EUKA|nr:hypothetical protein BLNAU_6083 [Blattamonas nauphoetae]
MLLLSTPVESSDPVFIVTGSLTLDSLSFVMFKSIERHQPLIHGTPESRVSISFVSFEWDEVSITTPLILVTSATLHLKTTNFQFDCIVSAPVISSTLSPVYLDGVTFSGPTLKSDGRFIQLHETVKFYCKNLFMEDIMSEAPSALSIQLNEGSIDISQTTISEVTLFSENASVVSITASQAYVVLSWISVSQVSSAKTNASQIRISLHNSVLRLEDAVLQSYFDDSSSSALVVVTDSPEQLHIHVDLMTSLQTSEISPSLLLIGPFIKEHLAQICRGIVSRTFHPSAALWKNNENEEGRLLFADEMVSRTSFHVCDVGLDRLSCGAPSQPCQSLSYSLLLPHSSTETSFVLIGSVHLSTSVYLDDESIMLVGGREGSSLLSIDPSSGFFNSISMESIYVKDLTLQLDGNDVLESEPFISVNAGELEVYMCSVEVTSGNWDFAVLSVTDGKGKLFGLHVYSLSPSLPVILTAIRSSVFLAAIQSYTHSVNIPLVSLEEMDHQTLTIDGWKQDSPRAVWECPLFESDALLTDTSFEFLNLEMKNHVLANTAFLFDLSFTNSSIVFSFCSFTGIVPQSTALAEGSLASSHLLRLTLILSDFELTHCSFVSCSRSDEICLTLISLELYNTVVSVTNNSFSQCNSNSLVIQHPSFHTLIRHSSFISNTFNNTPDPVLEWDGVQQSLLRLISNYHRTLIGIGVLVGLLILLLLSILLVFPFFCITRQCASRPPVFRFWWRDGGESAKVDTRDPELIGRLAKPTHQFIYLYQNDLESLKRGRVDGRWRGLIVLI